MPKPTYILFFFFFLIITNSLLGQSINVKTLEKQAKNGTEKEKIAALNALTTYYCHSDIKKAKRNNQAALVLAQKDSVSPQLSIVYANWSRIDYGEGKYEEAIEHATQSIQIARPLQKPLLLANAYTSLGLIYSSKGYAHKALEYIIKALKITENEKDATQHLMAYHTIGKAYLNLDNPEQAIRFLNKTLLLQKRKKTNINPVVFLDLGLAQLQQDQLNTAAQNISLGFDLCQKSGNKRGIAYAHVLMGKKKLLDSKIEEATQNYTTAIQLYLKLKDKIGEATALQGLAQVNYEQEKYKLATKELLTALDIAKLAKAKSKTKQIYKDLSDVMYASGEYEESFQYYRRYHIIKDSIIDRDKNREIAEIQIKHNAQVLKREKEELIEKNKNQALQIELRIKELSIQRLKNNQNIYVIIGLGSVLVLALIIGFLILRQKNLQTQIRETELEQRALRSQMNPHFMFNSLNSIQSLIATGDNSAASIYLAKFARLMRRILQNTRETYIPMQQEIDFLNNYIELEQRRFKEAFSFEVDTEKVEDAHFVMIPPLVIQPFIENAIIHGLLRKSEKGKLLVIFEDYNAEFVKCTVSDNGIGRVAAAEFKSDKKHESLGIKITEQRLEYLTIKQKNKEKLIQVKDLKDSNGNANGTAVTLLLPIKYKA